MLRAGRAEGEEVTEGDAIRDFDVFLSHNSRDKPAVERVAEHLRGSGFAPWLDKWCLTPGGDWQAELAEGLRASRSCAVFVGPSDVGAWEGEELRVALDRAANDRSFRLFLVLLPGVADPFDPSALSPFLSTRTWVDLRAGIASTAALQRLVNAVKGVPEGPPAGPARVESRRPYRGLRAFDEEDASLFFGREADVQRLREKLKESPFLAVLGPSGSGKSSLVRAGLLPVVRAGALPGSDTWTIEVVKPGARPLDTLATALGRLYPHVAPVRALDDLRADVRALRLALTRPPAGDAEGRVVLVIDQFEEVFTLCRDQFERRVFIENLLHSSAADGPATVVLTMRADFYPRCAAHPELAQQISAHQFLVGPLTREGLEQAIGEPARRVGLELEAGLVDTIRADVEHQPGALPLLQHALLELWERRRGSMLTLEAYRESGGVDGALAQRADMVFSAFAPEEQEIARRVLLRLTQPGEGAEDTRRRASFEELVTRESQRPDVEQVVAALADARLLTADSIGDEEVVDVAHEALIRGWPRLRRWVEDDREGLRIHRRLTEAAGEWVRGNRDPELLFRGARLAEAQEWHTHNEEGVNDDERAFLAASVDLRQRERRSKRRRAVLFTVILTALVSALALSFFALAQREKATQRERVARRAAAANTALLQLPRNPERSLRTALDALRHYGPDDKFAAVLRSAIAQSHLRGVVPAGGILTVAFSPDGRSFVTGSDDGSAQIWNTSTLKSRARFVQSLGGGSSSIAVSNDGRSLLTAGDDGTFRLWDIATARQLSRPGIGHTGPITSAEFTFDGKRAVTASVDKTARVWDTRVGGQVAVLRGHTGPVASAAWDPSGKRVVTASDDGSAIVWDASEGRVLQRLSPLAGPLSNAVFTHDGRTVLTATVGGGAPVVAWNANTGGQTRAYEASRKEARPLAFSPDLRLVAFDDGNGGARVQELASGTTLATLRGHNGAIVDAAFSADAKLALTVDSQGKPRLWNVQNERSITRKLRQAPFTELVVIAQRHVTRQLRLSERP